MRIAAAAERGSEHPLAAAIVAEADRRGLRPAGRRVFESVTGQGVRATVAEGIVLVGSAAFLAQQAVDTGAVDEPAAPSDAERQAARSIVLVALDGAAIGSIGIDDPIKPTAAAAVRQLRDLGIEVHLVSGDSAAAAAAVARRAGIESVHVTAEVLPG